jgi:four helix bundle suffix protein
MSEIVYDGTEAFCRRFLKQNWRMTDQMVQAARSGRQNIAEGSAASGTSSKTELKLVGVARASLEELLLDFQDYLRQRELEQWPKEHEKATFIRKLGSRPDRTYTTYKTYIEEKTEETAANTLICVIHQTCFLLDQVKRQLERQFLAEGGFTERMHRVRSNARKQGL